MGWKRKPWGTEQRPLKNSEREEMLTMKGQTSLVLPVLLALDLLIPCLLAPSFRGYDAWTQVMSVLGQSKRATA